MTSIYWIKCLLLRDNLSVYLNLLLLLKRKKLCDIYQRLTTIVSNIRPNEDMAAPLQCVSTVWLYATNG